MSGQVADDVPSDKEEAAGAAKGITLCLSGGGLRATLFHLGVIKAMRRYRIGGDPVLKMIRDIYSVSGGSITAAHLIKYWADYTGSDADFANRENELIAFAGRNLRDRVVRRAMLLWWVGLGRTKWLRQEYRSLFGQDTFKDVYDQPAALPVLHIMTTSFKTGELCAFSPDRFEIMQRNPDGLAIVHCPAEHIELALAVSASSAFPPLFPPVTLSAADLNSPDEDAFKGLNPLSDGGVFDNLGIETLVMHPQARPKGRLVIASNAGASFHAESASFAGPLARNVRANDIMMRRIYEATGGALKQNSIIHHELRIGNEVEGSLLIGDNQKAMRRVRTDLDRFAPDLARVLIHHGYEAGAQLMRSLAGEAIDEAEQPPPASMSAPRLAKAAKIRWWTFIRPATDWAWVTLAALLLVIVYAGVRARQEIQTSRQAEQQVETDKKNKEYMGAELERLRKIYLTGDKTKFEQAFGATIFRAEQSEQNPQAEISTQPVAITDQQAQQLTVQPVAVPTLTPQGSYQQPVVVQFAGTLRRAEMIALVESLHNAGWATADRNGGERIATAAEMGNLVLFSGEENRAAAHALAESITQTGLVGQVREQGRTGIGSKLEVWIHR